MKRRLFVAINLPDEIKTAISRKIDRLQSLFGEQVRFLSSSSWHITMSFLAYQEDEALPTIIDAIKDVADKFVAPDIDITNLEYGPQSGLARMLWLTTNSHTAEQLGPIKKQLENLLIDRGLKFPRTFKSFHPHITLAKFSQVSRKELPELDEKLGLSFVANGLEIMESTLKRSGAEYDSLSKASFDLL
ncbi:MAG: RNA 2',3'-cyclic phosphodiesterase [bacterium]|nr:RNA 2',3'-cyclic phosphodiesterase [bacterium]